MDIQEFSRQLEHAERGEQPSRLIQALGHLRGLDLAQLRSLDLSRFGGWGAWPEIRLPKLAERR